VKFAVQEKGDSKRRENGNMTKKRKKIVRFLVQERR